MTTRSELVKRLRNSIVQQTNKRGYLDITEETVSEVLSDLEQIINIEYQVEASNEQLELISE